MANFVYICKKINLNFAVKILLFFAVFFNVKTDYSKTNNDLEISQSEFIFKSGNKTKTGPNSSNKFTVALVGSSRDTKKLLSYINDALSSKKIRSRKVVFSTYKSVSQTGNEDLIVFMSLPVFATNLVALLP